MSEKIFKERFCEITKIKVCTTTAELNFDTYTEPGTYEIYEDMGNGQSRVYFLTVDKSISRACLKQTRIHCGKVDARNTTTTGTWTAWAAVTGGGSDIEEITKELEKQGYVKNTDYATHNKSGVIKATTTYGTEVTGSGQLRIFKATESEIDKRNSNYRPIVPSNLEHAVKSVGDGYYATEEKMDEVEAVAKGRATGYVFDTLADLDAWLSDTANTEKLVLGDNLYIRATDVPDYWWDGSAKQLLETQKVDLTEYAKKSEVSSAILVSGQDKLASIIPEYGREYLVRYDNLPISDEDGNITISGKSVHVLKIGDGVTTLDKLPPLAHVTPGEGEGSFVQFIEEEACGFEQDGVMYYPRPIAPGYGAVALGRYTEAHGDNSMAVNYDSVALGERSFACNQNTLASGSASFASGWLTVASGKASHAEGQSTEATLNGAHAEGIGSKATDEAAHAEGYYTTASGYRSHSEGTGTEASGNYAHAEGNGAKATGMDAHAEGMKTVASNSHAHAEGANSDASGQCAHAEGYKTQASGNYSHAQGCNTVASGGYSHAQGLRSIASGGQSFAGGLDSVAEKQGSFAYGNGVKSTRTFQTAFGNFNKSENNNLFEIGNGTADDARSNAFAVGLDNSITVGSTKLTEEQLNKLLAVVE